MSQKTLCYSTTWKISILLFLLVTCPFILYFIWFLSVEYFDNMFWNLLSDVMFQGNSLDAT